MEKHSEMQWSDILQGQRNPEVLKSFYTELTHHLHDSALRSDPRLLSDGRSAPGRSQLRGYGWELHHVQQSIVMIEYWTMISGIPLPLQPINPQEDWISGLKISIVPPNPELEGQIQTIAQKYHLSRAPIKVL